MIVLPKQRSTINIIAPFFVLSSFIKNEVNHSCENALLPDIKGLVTYNHTMLLLIGLTLFYS